MIGVGAAAALSPLATGTALLFGRRLTQHRGAGDYITDEDGGDGIMAIEEN